MSEQTNHPKYELLDDPHATYRYKSAMKHVEYAKAAGKLSEEIHAMFKKIMSYDLHDIDSLPQDEGHKQFRSAVIHAHKAMEAGKSSEEVHQIFQQVLASDGTKSCGHHK